MRIHQLFNQDWQFILSDDAPGPEAEWRPVRLPHDWSTEYELREDAPTGGGGGYARAGIGWYRRLFTPDADFLSPGKHVSLLFDGVYMDATVYLNGKEIGHHGYGYTPFEVSLDGLLPGENLISVRVDNSHQPNSRWYTGSGIYRNVHLTVTDDIRIALHGVRCTTSSLFPEYGKASLTIRTLVENRGQSRQTVGVLYRLLDRDGNEAAFAGTSLSLKKDSCTDCEVRPEIDAPHLWSAEDPYLYTLVTTLQADGETVDELSTPVGIRTAVFDCDRGFLLNGASVKLKGMCLHHDCGLFGAVGYRDVWERRLTKLKDMGCNAIRCAHNPPDPAFLDLCDELGFLVMDEIFDEWLLTKHKNNNYYSQSFAYGSSMFFAAEAKTNLVAMLRRDFNHPSVILWSIGNEIPEQSSIDGPAIAKYLQDICHEEDCTRMVTSACDNIAANSTGRTLREFENVLDVVGYNYVGRWRGRAETFYDEDRQLFPKRRMCGSENPSVGGDRGIYGDDPFWGSYAKATLHHEALWRYTVSRDFVAGDYLWTGIDYLGECRWPRKGASCGPLDLAGLEKDSYYYFRSIWNKEDYTLHLLPHWNWPGQEGQFKQVVCYTGCEEVELYLNGRLIGKKGLACPRYGAENNWYEHSGRHATTNDLHLTWDVPYEPGELKAIGYVGGEKKLEYSIFTTGAPAALQAAAWKTAVPAGGILQLETAAFDASGRFVPDAEAEVTCTVEGPARLLGLDNGSVTDRTLCSVSSRRLFSGKLFAALAADAPGRVTVTFSAEGLKSASVELTVTA
ncbi:MAG: DUF4982 domain-containing protein [bacterium]|nr:DUF4982 domain-containing protein [bacterium]